MNGKLHNMVLYPWEKGSRYPLDRKLGWAPERVWTLWRKKTLAPVGNRNPGPGSNSTHDEAKFLFDNMTGGMQGTKH